MTRLAPLLFLAATAAGDDVHAVVGERAPIKPPEHVISAPLADSVWYRGVRLLDLTGDGQPDSIILTAIGHRSDSLTVRLVFIVNGDEAYRETWTSRSELVDPDLPDTTAAARDRYMRTTLARILARVRTEPLDTADVRRVNGPAMLRQHRFSGVQVAFSYGYESILTVAWDARSKQFVHLRSCC